MTHPIRFTGYSPETPASYNKLMKNQNMAKLSNEGRAEILSYLAEEAFQKAVEAKGPDVPHQDRFERTVQKPGEQPPQINSKDTQRKSLSHKEIALHNLFCTLNPKSRTQAEQLNDFLRRSLERDDMPVFKLLLGLTPNPDHPALVKLAVSQGNQEAFDKLIAHAEKKQCPIPVKTLNPLLHLAVEENSLDMVTALLDQGVDPNILDPGVDPNIPDADGHSPLYRAAFSGRHALGKVLVAKGAHLNLHDCTSPNPLWW